MTTSLFTSSTALHGSKTDCSSIRLEQISLANSLANRNVEQKFTWTSCCQKQLSWSALFGFAADLFASGLCEKNNATRASLLDYKACQDRRMYTSNSKLRHELKAGPMNQPHSANSLFIKTCLGLAARGQFLWPVYACMRSFCSNFQFQ